MDWLWNVTFGIIGYVIGMVAASWPTVQVGSALFCAFPLLRRLRYHEDCFNLKGCKRVFVTTIVINGIILAAIICAVVLWAPRFMHLGFWIGYGFTLLLGIKQMGINQNNVEDFLRILHRFIRSGKEDEATLAVAEVLY